MATAADVARNNANPPRQASGNGSAATPLEEETSRFLMKNFEYSLIFVFAFVVFVAYHCLSAAGSGFVEFWQKLLLSAKISKFGENLESR